MLNATGCCFLTYLQLFFNETLTDARKAREKERRKAKTLADKKNAEYGLTSEELESDDADADGEGGDSDENDPPPPETGKRVRASPRVQARVNPAAQYIAVRPMANNPEPAAKKPKPAANKPKKEKK